MSWKQNTMRGMRSNSAINQPTGGGPKKSGLAASNLGGAGVGLLHGRTYMGGPRGVQANYRNKDVVFHYKSYIGGIGHSVGGTTSYQFPKDQICIYPAGGKMNKCSVMGEGSSSTGSCELYYEVSEGKKYVCTVSSAPVPGTNEYPCKISTKKC